jgi:hypothetical protein
MLEKLFAKEIITAEELETIEEHEEVKKVEDNGCSGKYPDCNWYTVYMVDGGEHDVYIKRS